MDPDLYQQEVRARIIRAQEDGFSGFLDILARVEGADPRLVRSLMDDIATSQPTVVPNRWQALSTIRSSLLDRLPASDPALGQWWYTPETQEQLARRILDFRRDHDPFRVLCIGAPTVAPLLVEAGCEVDVAEVDPDIIDALQLQCPQANAIRCDLLKEKLQIEPVHVALVDPPWYAAEMMAFLRKGIQRLAIGGSLIVSLPPLLTRPTIGKERQKLLEELQTHGADMLFLDRNMVKYVVPSIEESAFRDVSGFCGQPWRVADLLVCVKHRDEPWEVQEEDQGGAVTAQRFSRDPREFRVFLGVSDKKASFRTMIVKLDDFSSNVSRRAHGGVFPNVWTTEKTGALVEDIDEAKVILSCWEAGHDKRTAQERLVAERKSAPETAQKLVEQYDEVLEIWSKFQTGVGRRLPEQIRDAKKAAIDEKWATPGSNREFGSAEDGFRLEFPRDRDRVLWSGNFRKLAGKTQLFPIDDGDQLRQRLAHSVEVMQLAGTIADSFGLDRDLVEAGALAHDIGHTPFGHAGEHALDRLLEEISPTNSPGFNHYEHGVDVVRYLEGPYQHLPRDGHMGLNLMPEVCECIFKHTYCQGGTRISHDEIRKRSKHQEFLDDGYCHLEGQAVRIADKVSYLISDIEDGIRLDAVDEVAIMSCRLFHRPPIDLSQPKGEPLLRRFLLQRRSLLRVLMEDIITETGRRLVKLASRKDVPGQNS